MEKGAGGNKEQGRRTERAMGEEKVEVEKGTGRNKEQGLIGHGGRKRGRGGKEVEGGG